MKKSRKRMVTLPQVNSNERNYLMRSIDIAKKGCYDNNRKLKIDEGFGDYNMNLFRLRNKRQYVRDIPSAFSPAIKDLLKSEWKSDTERRIVTEYNEKINEILFTPKQIYLDNIKKQREQKYRLQQQQKQRNKYMKGFDEEIREYNDHLSFNYLSNHQSNNWFKIKDNSSFYEPPTFIIIPEKEVLTTPKYKPRKRAEFIFLSDKIQKQNLFQKRL